MQKLLLLLLLLPSLLFGQSGFMLTKASGGVVGKDSIRVQFDTSSAVDQSGWTIMRGDLRPGNISTRTITATGGNSGTITVTASGTNWLGGTVPTETGGGDGPVTVPGNGVTNGAVWNYAPNVQKENWVNSKVFASGTPQVMISGLKASTAYTIQLTVSLNDHNNYTAFDQLITHFYVGSALASILGPTDVIYANEASEIPNVSGSATFATVTSDSAGKIYIWCSADGVTDGLSVAGIAAFILKEL